MNDDIESGYHFYNQQIKEFDEKEYPEDKRCAVSYAAGVERGKHQIKAKVAQRFKTSHINWNEDDGQRIHKSE